MIDRGSMVNWGSVVGRGSGVGGGRLVGSSFRVLSLTGVTDISDISTFTVDRVGDSLDTAVGKVDRVRSCGGVSVTGLSGVEGRFGVVVSYSVSVGVHRGLIGVSGGSMVSRGSMVSWGSMVNRGISSAMGVVSHGAGKKGKGDEGLKINNMNGEFV